MAIIADILAIKWQEYRHKRHSGKAALIAAFLALKEWIPLWIAFQTWDITILLASNLGSVVGSYLGVEWEKRLDKERHNS